MTLWSIDRHFYRQNEHPLYSFHNRNRSIWSRRGSKICRLLSLVRAHPSHSLCIQLDEVGIDDQVSRSIDFRGDGTGWRRRVLGLGMCQREGQFRHQVSGGQKKTEMMNHRAHYSERKGSAVPAETAQYELHFHAILHDYAKVLLLDGVH